MIYHYNLDMNSRENKIVWAVLLAELGHIFCCGIPALFSLISLLTGLGFLSAMPPALETMHGFLHDYELYVIIFSLAVLSLGWFFYWYSKKLDCASGGCAHEPCGPKKDITKIVLIVATGLFIFNTLFYLGIHT